VKKVLKKGAAGVAEVVEHLPSKHEALNSNPSTVQNKMFITWDNALYFLGLLGGLNEIMLT
jgi:hypothetical protein